MKDLRGTAIMNEQKAKKLRRIECAHDRFAGILLAVGMPPKNGDDGRRNRVMGFAWYDNGYRERVREFYLASFSSAPLPNTKTVKKFVRSYMRWLQHQHNHTLEKWKPDEV